MKRTLYVISIILFVIYIIIPVWAEVPPKIMEQLKSPDVDERLDACLILGRLGSKDAVPILRQQLRDKSMLIRHSAANALARIGGSEVNAVFKEMVRTGGTEARRLGLAGLAMTGDPESIDLVMASLSDPDWQVRWSAVYALGQWGYRPAIKRLDEIAKNDPYKDSVTGLYPVRKRAEEMSQKISSSIEWYRNFDNAIMLSKKLKRPVWIYWYAKDSDWCKKIEEGVFFSPDVSDISQHFVCVKLDVEDWSALASQCEVMGAPLNIILDIDGNELDRILGYTSRDKLIKKLKNAIENKSTPREWKDKISEDPGDVEASWYLAEWYLDNGKMKDAISLLENIVKNDNKNRLGYTDNALFVLGFSMGAVGEYRKAVDLLEELSKDYPKFKDMDKALYCLGLSYLSLNEVEKAKEKFTELINNYPDSTTIKPTEEILKKL